MQKQSSKTSVRAKVSGRHTITRPAELRRELGIVDGRLMLPWTSEDAPATAAD